LGLPRPIIKSHPQENPGVALGLESSLNVGFPFNISATAEASDLKFGAQVGFVKAHHKIARRRKSGRGHGL